MVRLRRPSRMQSFGPSPWRNCPGSLIASRHTRYSRIASARKNGRLLEILPSAMRRQVVASSSSEKDQKSGVFLLNSSLCTVPAMMIRPAPKKVFAGARPPRPLHRSNPACYSASCSTGELPKSSVCRGVRNRTATSGTEHRKSSPCVSTKAQAKRNHRNRPFASIRDLAAELPLNLVSRCKEACDGVFRASA